MQELQGSTRRKPKESLLWKLVQGHWPAVERDLREAGDGAPVPKFIAKAVAACSRRGILKYGFCRVYCPSSVLPAVPVRQCVLTVPINCVA